MCHPRYVKERLDEAEWTQLRIAQDAILSTNWVDDNNDEDDGEERRRRRRRLRRRQQRRRRRSGIDRGGP